MEDTINDIGGVHLIDAETDMEAEVIISKLAQFGIPVLKRHKESGAYLSLFIGASPYGLSLDVPADMLEQAREILDTTTDVNPDEVQANFSNQLVDEDDSDA